MCTIMITVDTTSGLKLLLTRCARRRRVTVSFSIRDREEINLTSNRKSVYEKQGIGWYSLYKQRTERRVTIRKYTNSNAHHIMLE